ncbi:UNVERIFIED_ORG: ribonuclease VapC [Methylobacterium sp. SuP10 SLI 274]|uniref:type II toxin-antitoxin system VapC family toxin n=1 Tax=Methylorubrum extorquens TaxID=408 RepID=UPI00209E8693|nr:type II toxin-antitoxin system VapC family toxin [Methylorubrum extorquens]MDF9866331.1 ribonuclease VapC [Methylorubrum pseudosasae]MDH6639872.1 ribonuclease VapC [Methylobacterium sp. SuP10 SLI 274]MDH6669067.1 ribonuclease VapC [Methylorubrum zatmanii]MCP1560945.1 ribonuclease VapC [Methylorubrum extorquens]MDF9794624.1 ribonuclease VapC [Methylorubrum extorquens]
MFVDASALIAIITEEPEGRALSERLEAADVPITSPVAVYEAALGIARKKQGGLKAARADVAMLLDLARIGLVPITPEDGERALDAFERYGKGTGHPARLNMGDCFAYAVAQNHGVPLLYKGEDFALTDLGS